MDNNQIVIYQTEDGLTKINVKVENETVWNDVKNGKYNGFSIEGYFDLEEPKDEIEELIDELLSE